MKTDRHTVKSLMAVLATLPPDGVIVVDNHGECRFLKTEDVDLAKHEYVCMDKDECSDGENDPEVAGSLFPCVVRLLSWS